MRADGFTIQQALTPDAASIIKQSVTLAKLRGHAQVTPLHVAHTMLSSTPAGVLRTACQQSNHSHPLQCKALELCFSVALNRLPPAILSSKSATSSSSTSSSQIFPSISNALVAAFKRAQAQQRRGSVDNQQQQPLLTVKIELQQLVISILDDPSVSRVMREAGFSSIQVKNNINSTTSTNTTSIINEDVIRVIDNLKNKNGRNLVIVGENSDKLEIVVNGVMRNEDLLREVTFVKITLSERERSLEELKCLVKHNKRVFAYVGDLEWVIENKRRKICNNNDDDHDDSDAEIVDEIGKLVNCGNHEKDQRISILGFASLKTYIKCRNGCPSLQNLWNLHAITLHEVCNLGLSLIPESNLQSDTQSKKGENGYKRLNSDQGYDVSSCQKWKHKQTLNFTSISPHSLISCRSMDNILRSHQNTNHPCDDDTSLRMYTSSVVHETPSSTPSEVDYVQKFKEFNAENLKTLCHALEKKLPLHKTIIHEISSTILQCRSGMSTRRVSHHDKQETWFIFQGSVNDGAKKKIGIELAKSIFGSQESFVSISALHSSKKRGRDEKGSFGNLIDRLGDEMLVNPHRVFLVEDLDEMDYWSQMSIRRAIEKGYILRSSGEEISLSDAIVILSYGSLSSRSNENLRSNEKNVDGVSLNLSICINDGGNHEFVNDVELFECVDKCIIFKL